MVAGSFLLAAMAAAGVAAGPVSGPAALGQAPSSQTVTPAECEIAAADVDCDSIASSRDDRLDTKPRQAFSSRQLDDAEALAQKLADVLPADGGGDPGLREVAAALDAAGFTSSRSSLRERATPSAAAEERSGLDRRASVGSGVLTSSDRSNRVDELDDRSTRVDELDQRPGRVDDRRSRLIDEARAERDDLRDERGSALSDRSRAAETSCELADDVDGLDELDLSERSDRSRDVLERAVPSSRGTDDFDDDTGDGRGLAAEIARREDDASIASVLDRTANLGTR